MGCLVQNCAPNHLSSSPPSASLTRPPLSSSSSSSPSSASNGFRLATWNIRSLRNKYVAVEDTIQSCNLDLLVITETWHRLPSDVAVRRSMPSDFAFVDQPRQAHEDTDARGGGIVIIHRAAHRVS